MQRKKEYKEEYKQVQRIRLIGLFLAGLFLLSGCTKKEELLLLSGEISVGEEDIEKGIPEEIGETISVAPPEVNGEDGSIQPESISCILYTSEAAD
ncbi:MAG: hypothetical protein K2N37_03815, partial [Lachnospiraceae bacterium]|nr:hypothetical protein [Lachnospiraceae bacterium]